MKMTGFLASLEMTGLSGVLEKVGGGRQLCLRPTPIQITNYLSLRT